MDPFSGLGTTAQTARCMGAKYIGIELNPKYVEMSIKHIRHPARWWLREKDVKITVDETYPTLLR
jgi:DNA modification methylase